MKLYGWLKVGLLMGLGLTSFSLSAQSDSQVRVLAGEPVQIGIAVDLSNRLAASGLDVAQAASLAIQEFNERGGLLGFEVEAWIEDDLCEPEAAVLVAQKFAADPSLVAVLGHACSGSSIAASDIYEEARIPMVSASSTSGLFTARNYDIANRVAVNDNFQGLVGARYIHHILKPKRVIILHNGTAYGQGLAETVQAALTDLGREVILFEAIDPANLDYSEQISAWASLQPDLIYFGGYSKEASLMIEQIRMGGLPEVRFFAGDGVFNQDYLDFADGFGNGTYITAGEQMGDMVAYENFVSRYEAEYGIKPFELGNYHAQAFDAANVILQALQQVAELDEDGNLLIDREDLIQAIRSTQNHAGLSGTISCNEVGDCGTAVITLYLAFERQWVRMGVPPKFQVSLSD